MSASNEFENDLQKLIYNNVDIAGIGDAGGLRGSVAAGNLYVSLHTLNPDETGDQSTGEITYTGYNRVPVVRSAAGWTVVAQNVVNAADVVFGECTGAGGVTATHFGVGADPTPGNPGKLLFYGQLDNPRTINVGITPQFAAGTLQNDVD